MFRVFVIPVLRVTFMLRGLFDRLPLTPGLLVTYVALVTPEQMISESKSVRKSECLRSIFWQPGVIEYQIEQTGTLRYM